MRNIKCDDCGQTFPLSETFKITEKVSCKTCAEKLLKSRKDITNEQIQRQYDPTVCANCGKDNGDWEMKKMAGLPTCEQCMTFFRNRPYPLWIKMALAGLAAIVVFSFAWNWRFIQAYTELRNFKAALLARDSEKATQSSRAAAEKVPEAKWLSAMASYFEAMQLIKEDKPAEALKLLNSCKADLPSTLTADELILLAETGVAFDNKDYEKFLLLAIQSSEKHPDSPKVLAQVASAYACKYAVTDDEQFKQKSLDFLQKARTLTEKQGGLDKFAEYENRILYRIETRNIISREEFKNKFPNGWKSQQKEQSK